jgi:hypothetical protein
MRRALLSLLLVSACSSLVPSTTAQLAQLSPLEADPAAIALAIQLPPGLVVPEGGAKMVVEATRKATGETRRGDYVLASEPGDPAQFAADPGDSVTFYRLAPDDIAPMRDLQTIVADWKTADPDGTAGSFSMGLAGCAVGQGPEPDAKGSVYIRTVANGAYLPLIQNASIKALIGPDLFAAIGPCTSHPR